MVFLTFLPLKVKYLITANLAYKYLKFVYFCNSKILTNDGFANSGQTT
jgi:hypothetical protein